MSDHWTWPRRAGRNIMQQVLIEAQLRRGEHVHRVTRDNDAVCEGGDSECSLFAAQLGEAMEAWS